MQAAGRARDSVLKGVCECQWLASIVKAESGFVYFAAGGGRASFVRADVDGRLLHQAGSTCVYWEAASYD